MVEGSHVLHIGCGVVKKGVITLTEIIEHPV